MYFEYLAVPGSEVLEVLRRHRAGFSPGGAYPFLIGDESDLNDLRQAFQWEERTPEEIIRASWAIDAREWFARVREENLACDPELDEAELEGQWPEEPCEKHFISHHLQSDRRKHKPRVYLGLVKLECPWQLPAWLGFGCPEGPQPEEHCALFRYWEELYGAELVTVGFQVLEARVARPPQDRQTALALAWELYWYCGDIFAINWATVSHLASSLLGGEYWYFWWD